MAFDVLEWVSQEVYQLSSDARRRMRLATVQDSVPTMVYEELYKAGNDAVVVLPERGKRGA